MKAITCSQCGALIKRVRIRDKFAECEYCHATIPILKEKVIVIDDKKEPKQQPQPKQYVESNLFEINPETIYTGWKLLFMSIILIGGFIFAIGAVAYLLSSSDFTPERPIAEQSESQPEYEPTDISTEVPTPIPSISYKTYVKYNSLLGAEHIEQPSIEFEQLATLDKDELKKTVFKQKRVRVNITINKNGEVTDAKALNGHEVLQTISVRAAKKTLFSTRKKEEKATLTYIFVLED